MPEWTLFAFDLDAAVSLSDRPQWRDSDARGIVSSVSDDLAKGQPGVGDSEIIERITRSRA